MLTPAHSHHLFRGTKEQRILGFLGEFRYTSSNVLKVSAIHEYGVQNDKNIQLSVGVHNRMICNVLSISRVRILSVPLLNAWIFLLKF